MAESEFDFAASLKELEAITTWFESDEIDLDQALAKFERGMKLAAALRQHLSQTENRIEKIRQQFAPPASPAAGTDDVPEPESPEAPPELFQ